MDLSKGRIWGNIMILSIETVIMGDVSSEREVGVSPWYITTWLTYLGQHWCRAQYMLFYDFYDIKIYRYYVLKSICIIKGTLVVFDFALARRCQRGFFYQPVSFKGKDLSTNTTLFYSDLTWWFTYIYIYIYIYIYTTSMILITYFRLLRNSTW